MAQRTNQNKIGLSQLGQPKLNQIIAEYDFATEGGAVGDITLRGDTLPSGAQVVDADILVETALTSGGAATVALKAEGAADINAADLISGAPWSTTGPKKADKLAAADNGFATTADRAITATVGAAALTAGKFQVVVKYFLRA